MGRPRNEDKTVKYQIKVFVRNQMEWLHFCYIPFLTKRNFDRKVNHKGKTNNDWIGKWAMEDFGLDKIDREENYRLLRDKIQEKYKKQYPLLYVNKGGRDMQGWLRVWVAECMEREIIEKHGTE